MGERPLGSRHRAMWWVVASGRRFDPHRCATWWFAARRTLQRMRSQGARLLAVLGLLVVGLLGAPTAALASCAGREPAQVVADSDVVLTGRVTAVHDPGGGYNPRPVAWTIAVSAVHRGTASHVTHVRALPESPDLVSTGGSYVFALVVSGSELTASGCQDVVPEGTPGSAALTDAAGPVHAPTGDGTSVPGSVELDLGSGEGMSLTTMVAIGLVGLLVVTFGGLALAVGLGLLTRRRRVRTDGSDYATQHDSNGTPFK